MGRAATCRLGLGGLPLVVVAAVLLGACGGASAGGSGGSGGTGPPPFLTVVNESQFALLELKTHGSMEHVGATNLLNELTSGTPLLQQEEVDIVPFYGGLYVTVVREQVQNGPKIAITTGTAVQTYESSMRLLVFDESFRLMNP